MNLGIQGHGAGPFYKWQQIVIFTHLWDSSMFHRCVIFIPKMELCAEMECHRAILINAERQEVTFMTDNKQTMTGLSSAKAKDLQVLYGKNELTPQKKESFIRKVFGIICEPMFLLLIVAAIIYFLLGPPAGGRVRGRQWR
jgi:magnesium-transporting ATPase (P-type)